jgi:hypothetical protein
MNFTISATRSGSVQKLPQGRYSDSTLSRNILTTSSKAKFDLYTQSPSKKPKCDRDVKLRRFTSKKEFPRRYKILGETEKASKDNTVNLYTDDIAEGEYSAFKIGDEIKLIKNSLQDFHSISPILKRRKLNIPSRLNSETQTIKLKTLLPEEDQTVFKTEPPINKSSTNSRNNKTFQSPKCKSQAFYLKLDASKKNFQDKKFVLPAVHNLF